MTRNPEVDTVLRGVLGLLVRGEYDTLASITGEKHLTADDMREAIESYGCTLILPPGGQLPPDLDIFEVAGAFPRQLAAVMPLMTVEEGRSDLTVELALIESGPNLWTIEIDNIHVM